MGRRRIAGDDATSVDDDMDGASAAGSAESEVDDDDSEEVRELKVSTSEGSLYKFRADLYGVGSSMLPLESLAWP